QPSTLNPQPSTLNPQPSTINHQPSTIAIDPQPSTSNLPVVTLKPRRAMPFFNRHPWVFAGAIHRVQGDPSPGAEVRLHADDGEFIARGLFNPHSNIRVRLYGWNEDEPLEANLWSRRLDQAIALRRRLFPDMSTETACRMVASEADGISGLTVDRYGDWLLAQFTSLALWQRRDEFVRLLSEKLQPAGIWLRTEKGIRESEGLEVADGLVAGREPPRPLFIEENGVRYGVDVVEGQKTGFFLDQRENRRAVAAYVAGRRVLDVFCYSGGFALACAVQGGAKEVLGIDSSAPAITLARANAELNGVADRVRFEQGQAFEALERLRDAGERFDAVVLDPPKMTRHRKGLEQALRGYHSLNHLAVEVLAPDGLLVSCSCSGLVSREEFEAMLASVAQRSGRSIQILEARGQAPDHPVSTQCAETAYLKCSICRAVEP
ncbi:MAG: class I SAM-dependent rRNA methyltransferase, partial [Planctomycetales bacterium]